MNLRPTIRRTRLMFAATVACTTLAAGALAAAPADAGAPAAAPRPTKTTAHLFALNDFHGNIDPPTGSGGLVNGTPAGGVEYLATTLNKLRDAAGTPSLTVAAGDLIGASPLVSAAFHDEPTIESMNALGLDVTSVGNHEFDEGVTELLRMDRGGCHPTDGCQDGDGFAGADFPYLAANVVSKTTGRPILPPFSIQSVGGKRVGFIGVTLEGTPSIVNPAGITSVNFLDEAKTANKYAGVLRQLGVKSVVLLIHEGGTQAAPPSPNDISACDNFAGAITPIVAELRPVFKVVISGHTHRPYVCNLPNKSGATSLVTSAGSFGTIVTDVTIELAKSGRMLSASAHNVIVENGVLNPDGTWARDAAGNFIRNPALVDPVLKAIADKYRIAVAPLANRVVGSISANIVRAAQPNGESPLGDVIADGMLAYTAGDGAQLAFMNPGGIRADLSYANSPGGEPDGQVTYGEVFTVQPFNNLVTTRTYTGAQIKDVLEQQFVGFGGQTVQRILQVSDGFTYTYSTSAPAGSKVSNMALNGVPIDPSATYRVAMNDFLANGGDGFTNLTVGTNAAFAPGFDVDSLAAYLATGPIAPGPANRITTTP